jgi:hypothetical protein
MILPTALLVAAVGAMSVGAAPPAPHRYVGANIDLGLVQLTSPSDGRIWSAWAYRVAGQYDIAVSVLEAGVWSEPEFVGSADRLSQVQPALAVDAAGTVYMAYAVRETGQVFLASRAANSFAWSTPILVTPGQSRRSAPALRVVGDRLVVALRSGSGIEIVDLPLLKLTPVVDGMQDGPDTIPHAVPPPNAGGGDGSIKPLR